VERKIRRKREAAARRIIRKAEVRRRTGYSDTTIWRLERDDMFPRRVQIGPMAVGWYENEVDAWVASRIRQGGKRPPVQWRGGRPPGKATDKDEDNHTTPAAARQ